MTHPVQELNQDKWVKGISKVVDFGCSKWKFAKYLKQLPFVTEIIGIDVDQIVLEESNAMLRPIFRDYLEPRKYTDLDLYLMQGSIAKQDKRLEDTDAVVAIELIEHLHTADLTAFPENVFGKIRPKIAIFTTPNREFNVLFPSFEGPFRHWDHKFEWTREEFLHWVSDVTDQYPDYEASISGIGAGPAGTENSIGSCSQMVVFVRKDFNVDVRNGEIFSQPSPPPLDKKLIPEYEVGQESHVIVGHHNFIRDKDDRSFETKLFDEIMCHARQCAIYSEEWEKEETVKVDLDFLMEFPKVQELSTDKNTILEILRNNDVLLEEDEVNQVYQVVMPYEPWPSSESEVEPEDHEENLQYNNESEDDESDWG